MVGMVEFLATLTLDLVEKQSLVHYQKKDTSDGAERISPLDEIKGYLSRCYDYGIAHRTSTLITALNR